jgi:hypothetical protein
VKGALIGQVGQTMNLYEIGKGGKKKRKKWLNNT